MTTRLNINLNDDSAALLRKWADEEGRTITEVVRRIIGAYSFIRDECVTGDKELKIESRDGSSMTVTIL